MLEAIEGTLEAYNPILENNFKEVSVNILKTLEALGIQPPGIKEPCNTFVLFNGQYVQTEDSFVFTNRWDNE